MAQYKWAFPTQQQNALPGVLGNDVAIVSQITGGGGTPGGANTQLQFNNANAFGGSANLTFDQSVNNLAIGGNIVATGNVTGTYFFGNGAALTGITATTTYNNANVAAYLPSYTGSMISMLGNVTTTANVQASYFIGNGAGLTGLPASYSDSNVTTLLQSGNVSTNIVTGANVVANNISTALTLTSLGTTTLGNIANIHIPGGTLGQVIKTDGTGNLSWQNQVQVIPAVYFTAPTTGNNQVFTNTTLGSYTSKNDMTVFYNGSLLENTYYTLSGTSMTVNVNLVTGDTIDVIAQFANNVSYVQSGYGDSNVSALLSSGTNYSPINNANTIFAPTISGTAVNAGANNITMSGNVLSTTNNILTIDPNGDGQPSTGTMLVLGNLQILGTLTYNDATSTTTSNLVWQSANTAVTAAAASGGGLGVGPAGNSYATWTFSSGANSWQSNLPIIATGGVTAGGPISGTTGTFSGNVSSGANVSASAVVATLLRSTGNVTATGNITTTGNIVATANIVSSANITASYLFGNGSLLTGVPPNYTILNGTSNIQIPLTNGNINFTVAGTTPGVMGLGGLTTINVVASGAVVATGNVTGGNFVTAGQVTATGNATAGNLTTAGQVNATGNATVGNLNTAGQVTATGNISISGTGELIVATNNDHGGADYAGIMTMTNTNGGSTNPNKFIRLNNTGAFEIINSAYSATIFALDDGGNIGGVNNVTVNGALTQNNSSAPGPNGVARASSWSPATNSGTLTTLDNLSVQWANGGASNMTLQISAVVGTYNCYTNGFAIKGGTVTGFTNNTAVAINAGTWTTPSSMPVIGSGGDMVTLYVQDITNSRVYRVTAMHGTGNQQGSITIERIA